MAEIPHVTQAVTDPKGNATGNFVVKWPGMTTNDTGQPWQAAQWADRNFQVLGAFGGATVAMEGSNVASPGNGDFAPLHDSQGVAIAVTVAGFVEVSEVPWFTRPKITGGAGTSLDVLMMVRRTGR